MSQIASKNLYDLLGNDPELDPNREPEPPTKVIDKPVQRAGKRNAGAEGPGDVARPAAGGRGGRHQVMGRADAMGSMNNRAEQRDDGLRQDRHANRTREPREHREGGARGSTRGRGRGQRGGEFRGTRTARDDRHSRTNIGEHDKQAAHGWGAETGEGELADENAGDAIAKAEAKNESGFTPDTSGADPAFGNGPDGQVGEEDVAEPEEKTKSYDEYLAEQAEKRLALGGGDLSLRKANEGSKQKFPEGQAFSREQENYFSGAGGKQTRQKENKSKNLLAMDGQYYAPVDSGERRGGRGGARGGRGEGRGRGDRGRGEGRGRGGDRGGRGGRGDFRGAPRGGAPRGGAINTNDQSAFPSLGA